MVPNSCMMGRHDTDCYGYLVDTIKLMHAYNQQQFKKTNNGMHHSLDLLVKKPRHTISAATECQNASMST